MQPDALLRRLPEHGGQTRVNEAGYLADPPELIVEVAASSASIDLRDKRRAYCRNAVREELYHQLVPVVTPLAGPTGSLASGARSPLSWER